MLLIDEIEKAVAGLANGGRSDGGAKIEMVGALLTWLNDHKSDVFTIASANSVKDILENNPELLRAGRFDGMFMIDFPNRAAKDAIWKIHLLVYKHIKNDTEFEAIRSQLPKDDNWTGAEIENCCRLARLRRKTVAEVGKSIPIMATQAKDTIDATRKWAEGCCWSGRR